LRSPKLYDLQRVPDVMIEFGDGLHPRCHQFVGRFFFPRHLIEKSARKQAGRRVAEDEHPNPRHTFLKQDPVQENSQG